MVKKVQQRGKKEKKSQAKDEGTRLKPKESMAKRWKKGKGKKNWGRENRKKSNRNKHGKRNEGKSKLKKRGNEGGDQKVKTPKETLLQVWTKEGCKRALKGNVQIPAEFKTKMRWELEKYKDEMRCLVVKNGGCKDRVESWGEKSRRRESNPKGGYRMDDNYNQEGTI